MLVAPGFDLAQYVILVEDMSKEPGSAYVAEAGSSIPVVPSPPSFQVDLPPFYPPNNSAVGEFESTGKAGNDLRFGLSTASVLDANHKQTSVLTDREVELPEKKASDPSFGFESPTVEQKKSQVLSCGNLAVASTPLKPSMGVAGSIYTKRRYTNNLQEEDDSKTQEMNQIPVKDVPSRFITRAEFYTSPPHASKTKRSGDNCEQRKSMSSMTSHQLDLQRCQGLVNSSCQDLRIRSQEPPSSSFSTSIHGTNCEQALVHDTNTGRQGQTSFTDVRHGQSTLTTKHWQQPPADPQHIYTVPTLGQHFKNSSTDQIQIYSPPGKHCKAAPLIRQQDVASANCNQTPDSNRHPAQDTTSGQYLPTPQQHLQQHLQQQPLYRGASGRFLDRLAPAGVHARQSSVHVGFSAAELTGPGHLSVGPERCSPCQNLSQEIGDLRAKLGTVERQLNEKAYETTHLRETMERNEMAILQSFEEMRRKSNVESSALKRDFENYLRAQLQNSFRNEDTLRQHIAILTQENAQLQDRVTTLKSQREEFATRCIRAEWQLERTKRNVKDLTRELNQRKRETVGLFYVGALDEPRDSCPAQYSSPTAAAHRNSVGIRHWKSEDDMKNLGYREVGRGPRGDSEPEQSSDDPGSRRSRNEDATTAECVQLLQTELEKTRNEMELGRREFEEERSRWKEEKSKVLSYQRFLQMNYLQLLNGRGVVATNAEEPSPSGHRLSAIVEEDTL